MKTGIDVSKHNGIIDWQKVKPQIDFAIIRTGFGRYSPSQIDSRFEENYAACKKYGIPVGVYHYSYATTPLDAIAEADFVLQLIKGKQLEYPIFYDVEEKAQIGLSKETLKLVVKAFCDRIEKNNYWAGIYSMDSLFAKLDSEIQTRYTIWVARVENVKPTTAKRYDMHQYSWKGGINGIIGEVDMNTSYVDFADIIPKTELNGFKDEKPKEPEKPQKTQSIISVYSLKSHGERFVSEHFQVKEFKSVNSNEVKIHNKLIDLLERIFTKLNCRAIIINSGYRTPDHDKAVGGDGKGYHTKGMAADITCYDQKGKIIPAEQIVLTLEKMQTVYGIGICSETSVHVDTRPQTSKWWGDERNGVNVGKAYGTFESYFKSRR